MDINAVRAGLSANLAVIPGLQNPDGFVLSRPTPPCAWVVPGESEYHQAMQDGDEQEVFRVQVFVANIVDQNAQRLLGEFLNTRGEKSIKQALEAKKEGSSHLPANMPDGVYSVVVLGHDGQLTFDYSTNLSYLGTNFTVNVRAAPET